MVPCTYASRFIHGINPFSAALPHAAANAAWGWFAGRRFCVTWVKWMDGEAALSKGMSHYTTVAWNVDTVIVSHVSWSSVLLNAILVQTKMVILSINNP